MIVGDNLTYITDDEKIKYYGWSLLNKSTL